MKEETIHKLAQSIQLLHHDGNIYYTDTTLAKTAGVSSSTVKRNKLEIEMLDIVLHLSDNIQ